MTNFILTAGRHFGRFAALLLSVPLFLPLLVCLYFLDIFPIASIIGGIVSLPAALVSLALVLGLLLAGSKNAGNEGVSDKDAPGLWDLWRQTAGDQRAAKTRIYVTDELNAGVSEDRTFYGLGGRRFRLFVGLPLLAALDKPALAAVLAHEDAHLRRKDTNGSLKLAELENVFAFAFDYVPPDGTVTGALLDRALGWLSVPIGKEIIRLSREAEIDADRQSTRAGEPLASARALLLIAASAHFYEKEILEPLRRELLGSMAPPRPPLQRFLDRCGELGDRQALAKAMDGALQEPDNETDDHPPWQERLEALGFKQMPEIQPVSEPALAEMLDTQFAASLIAEMSKEWSGQVAQGLER